MGLYVEMVDYRGAQQIEEFLRRIYVEEGEASAGVREYAEGFHLPGLLHLLELPADNLTDPQYLLPVSDGIEYFEFEEDFHYPDLLYPAFWRVSLSTVSMMPATVVRRIFLGELPRTPNRRSSQNTPSGHLGE